MTALYQSLLKLYPWLYRCAFAEEMLQVFREAQTEAQQKTLGDRIAFYLRELTGLICGAARERLHASHICSGRNSNFGGIMIQRSGCRFPRFAIVMMMIVFVIAIEGIVKGQGMSHYLFQVSPVNGQLVVQARDLGRSIGQWPSHYGLISGIALCFLLAWIAGIGAWAVAYTMRRTGVQRLDDFQTWPQPQK